MSQYILRRLLLNVVVIWLVATLVFVAVRALPGDFVLTQVATNLELADNQAAIAEARRLLGLDNPSRVWPPATWAPPTPPAAPPGPSWPTACPTPWSWAP